MSHSLFSSVCITLLFFVVFNCQPFERITKVSTGSYENVTSHSCTVSGAIVDIGDEGIIQHGHCWSVNPNPTISNDKTEKGSRNTVYEYVSDLMELAPDKTYYVKAYATDKDGEHYGREISFTTLPIPGPAAPTNLVAEAVSKSQINLGWTDNSVNEEGFRIERSTDGTSWEEIATVGPDITTFQDKELPPSKKYYYRVSAFNPGGISGFSNVDDATTYSDIPAPVAPTNLAADAESSSQITINWLDNSDNEEGFIIERSPDSITWDVRDTVETNIYNYTDINLEPATAYFYKVRAYNAGGNSDYSNTAKAITFSTMLIPAPTNLVATAVSATRIDLRWDDNSTNERGFKIERAGESMNFREIDSVNAGTEYYVNEDLTPSVKYYYRVRAYSFGDYSDYSNIDSATTSSDVGVPVAPTDFVANPISISQVELHWTDISDNEFGFIIDRSINEIDWDQIASLDPDAEFFMNDIDVNPLTTYFYRIYAWNDYGSSDFAYTMATTCALPTAVTVDETNIGATSVTLNGIVNPNGFPTEVVFEYGLTEDLGIPIAAIQSPVSGSGDIGVNVTITDLDPNAIYYFQVKAVNCGGMANGEILSLMTDPIEIYDANDNIYPVVRIGNQLWMAKNLAASTYIDNSGEVLLVENNDAWMNLTTPGYCWYENDARYKDVYGALYNWYAVNTDKLCPEGWRVPSIDDWGILIDTLGGATVAGGKMKEMGTDYWEAPNAEATNESGFSARGAGWRSYADGIFKFIRSAGYWWSSTSETGTDAWGYHAYNWNGEFNRNVFVKANGFSVRCVRIY